MHVSIVAAHMAARHVVMSRTAVMVDLDDGRIWVGCLGLRQSGCGRCTWRKSDKTDRERQSQSKPMHAFLLPEERLSLKVVVEMPASSKT